MHSNNRPVLPVVCLGVFLLVVLAILYALFSAPAYWLVNQGYVSIEVTHAVYYPLRMLCSGWEPTREAYSWYTGIFLPPAPPAGPLEIY